MAKLDRKPRRNIQYKDIGEIRCDSTQCVRRRSSLLTFDFSANAVSHKDNLEFLSDMVPKTVPYKQIKSQAAATRAKVTGDGSASASGVASPAAGAGGAGAEDASEASAAPTNGAGSHKKHKAAKRSSNAGPNVAELLSGGVSGARPMQEDDELDGPDDQLQSEAMRGRDGDVSMSG